MTSISIKEIIEIEKLTGNQTDELNLLEKSVNDVNKTNEKF